MKLGHLLPDAVADGGEEAVPRPDRRRPCGAGGTESSQELFSGLAGVFV